MKGHLHNVHRKLHASNRAGLMSSPKLVVETMLIFARSVEPDCFVANGRQPIQLARIYIFLLINSTH